MTEKNLGRVVALGGTGFLGRQLRDVFQSQTNEKIPNYLSVGSAELNLLDPASRQQIPRLIQSTDRVVFFSCLTPDKGKDLQTLFKNLEMVRQFIEGMGNQGIKQLVYISSDAVYSGRDALVFESSPLERSNLYSTMHQVREQLLEEWALRSKTPLLILRPTAMYGAKDTHNSYGPNRFVRTALQDGVISLFGHGEEVRDHLSGNDFSRVVFEFLKREPGPVGVTQVLNVATGKSFSFGEIAEMVCAEVASQFGRRVELRKSDRAPVENIRRFDLTELRRVLPDFQFELPLQGLKTMVQELGKNFQQEGRNQS